MPNRSGGQLVVDFLEAQGVTQAFGVPGESYLAVLDALHDSPINLTIARHEGGAAMMAEAWGKLSGRAGVCLVTRGPGATNASSGVLVAAEDSTPMLLLVGQIETGMRGRGAFQEVDYSRFFGGMAKWVVEIDDAARLPEQLARAWHIAHEGRPGPVVIALPEDVLSARVDGDTTMPTVTIPEPAADPAAVVAAVGKLTAAERPLVIAGGSRWDAEAVAALRVFSESLGLPVACSFRRQQLFDHNHENYAGDVGLGINPPLKRRIEEADALLLLGGRFAEVPSQGYTLLDIPSPRQNLIHVHPDSAELGRVYQPALAVHCTPGAFLGSANALGKTATRRVGAAHDDYLERSTAPAIPGALQMGEVMAELARQIGHDGILCNGAGNYATWVHRFWRFARFGEQLAPTCGSMGYGLPAAIAAKIREPQRPVIAFAGDGCFQMTGMEFATACQIGAAVVVIVVDNGMYGTIRMHQENHFPGRVIGTALDNPDFAALARACGGFGATVEHSDLFAAALTQALDAGKPALLHLKIDPRAITPDRAL